MVLKKALACLMLAGAALAQADDLSLAINMVNQARQARGVAPLAWNPDLAAYAAF